MKLGSKLYWFRCENIEPNSLPPPQRKKKRTQTHKNVGNIRKTIIIIKNKGLSRSPVMIYFLTGIRFQVTTGVVSRGIESSAERTKSVRIVRGRMK